MIMEAINNAVSCNCSNDLTTNRSFKASQTQLAAISSTRSLDLDLVTEEGDKVTLSIDTQASAVYAAYGEVDMDDNSFSGQWGEFSGGEYEREVAFSVEGDLNKQERREIRKVIKAINRMMNDFVKGKLDPMASKAQKLQGLETIDSLEVEMSYERQVMVAQQTEVAVSYDRTGGVAPEKRAPVPVVEAPVNKPVEVAKRAEIPKPAEVIQQAQYVKKEAEVVAMDMASEVVTSPAPLDPLKELADRLLEAYQDQAEQWNAFAGEVMDHIRDIFETAVRDFEDHMTGDEADDASDDSSMEEADDWSSAESSIGAAGYSELADLSHNAEFPAVYLGAKIMMIQIGAMVLHRPFPVSGLL